MKVHGPVFPSVILLLSALTACSEPQKQAADTAKPAEPPKPAYHVDGNGANDASRFLAGVPGRKGGAFEKLEQDAAWQEYSREFDSKWEELKARQIASVADFQKRELAPVVAQTKSNYVYYPFSGPDVLYLTTFFPDSKTNVMVGLEPVGSLPSPSEFEGANMVPELNGWRIGIASLYKRTFFVTSEMDKQFRGRVADGLLPMISMLLVRTGHDVEGIRYIRLSDSGEPLSADVSKTVDENGKKIRHQGVEVTYRKRGETADRKIYYFSTDMSKFGQNVAFQSFLKSLGKPDTLVKSASFLLHWKMCEDARTFILEQSNLILEDDTGVPYKLLVRANWKTSLFGQYSRPDRPFTGQYQADLDTAFADKDKVKPLGFNLGYGTGRRPTHLLLAIRTPDTLAPSAITPEVQRVGAIKAKVQTVSN